MKLHLIECKMGQQSPEHILKAKSQIDNGLSVLGSAFKSSVESTEGVDSIEDRPDRRYWWMQLHRLIASKTEVSKIKYSDVLSALAPSGSIRIQKLSAQVIGTLVEPLMWSPMSTMLEADLCVS